MANPTERIRLWDRHLALMDYNTEIYDATQRGRAEGVIEGHKSGLIEGHKSGLIEGQQTTNLANARGMKAKGIDEATIAEITGLSLDEIRRL